MSIRNTLSIAIPSRKEIFLNKTILDVLEHTSEATTIYPVLDGYEIPQEEYIIHDRVKYIHLLLADGKAHKRQGINTMVDMCDSEFVMSLDAHCLVKDGFDQQLMKDHFQNNLIQVPRRNRLDAENWCLQSQVDQRPPIDFEYIIFKQLIKNDSHLGIHGFKWDERTLKYIDEPIVDTITFQGSCWFMTKDWYRERGFMSLKYQGWGQEAECLSFETWKNGGRVISNKNTYYAHLHKGNQYGRMWHMNRNDNAKSYAYSYNLWINKNKDFFISLIEKFMPMPSWPKNWKEQIWKTK